MLSLMLLPIGLSWLLLLGSCQVMWFLCSLYMLWDSMRQEREILSRDSKGGFTGSECDQHHVVSGMIMTESNKVIEKVYFDDTCIDCSSILAFGNAPDS